jgi:spermidine/putrescine transport system permease protein
MHTTTNKFRLYGHLGLWLSLGACTILPSLLIVGASFLSHSSLKLLDTPWALSAYVSIADSLYPALILKTLVTALYVTLLCLLISYPSALALRQLPAKWQHIGLIAIIVPFWTSTLVRTYAILSLLQAKGWLSTMLLKLGVISQPLALSFSSTATSIGLVYDLLPMMLLPLYLALHAVDPSLYVAAKDLGVGAWRRFWHITLPLTSKGAALGCVLVYLPATSLFFVPDILGGAKGLMLGNLISDAFASGAWPLGAALCLCLMLPLCFLLACSGLYRWIRP